MGIVIVYCALVYVINFLVDVTYKLIDPRIKL
jgi:ABC-type dipeptide/oligopeptide/nickel transport system permease component